MHTTRFRAEMIGCASAVGPRVRVELPSAPPGIPGPPPPPPDQRLPRCPMIHPRTKRPAPTG